MEKIKSNEFDTKLKSSEYVIMDFSSPGCAPCKKVPALLQEVLSESSNKNISAFEVDVTENVEIAQKYMVLGVPTIIIFKNGTETQRFNSLPKKDKILKALLS